MLRGPGVENWWFGNAHDGDATINSTVTLSSNMMYRKLTIASGGILKPNGHMIFVRDKLTMVTNCFIRNNGSNSGGQAGGASGVGNILGSAGAGGNGGNGSNGFSGEATAPDWGVGGTGGSGGASPSNSGGTGGTALDLSSSCWPLMHFPTALMAAAMSYNATMKKLMGGSGGGGGAADSGIGGGGGGGGGVIWIASPVIELQDISCVLDVRGGNGHAAVAGPDAGGGGGGGGGLIILICGKFINADSGNSNIWHFGGNGANGTGGGFGGFGGAGGRIIIFESAFSFSPYGWSGADGTNGSP